MSLTGTVERSSVYEAIDILTSTGYCAERIVGQNRMFDIMAWKRGRTLCISVRSSRHARLASFQDYIHDMSRMISTSPAPGEVQFWIYHRPDWSRWRVSAGGASPIDFWDVDPTREAVTA